MMFPSVKRVVRPTDTNKSGYDPAAVHIDAGTIRCLRDFPVVYVCYDDKGVVLYVGVSKNGAMRPLNPRHHVLCDVGQFSLTIYPCLSLDDAIKLEHELIQRLQPALNSKA